MISFVISLVCLLLGYVCYGRFVERIFAPDNRPTPAVAMADGVDYILMPNWKIFMIQFLNIAGTGPIFGAIMGMMYGPAAYLWIVLGCIFAGATHDYLSGMLSMRHGGAGLPELVGIYLGNNTKRVMLIFSVLLLVMVGAVFVYSPALILGKLTTSWTGNAVQASMFWVVVIFVYYVIATLMPIDKIIGKIYPLFAFALLFMAVALMIVLFVKWPSLPEVWGTDLTPISSTPIFPALFITIACGAISGFHATQSPLMARCIKSEKQGRPIFYGAMITEGVVALIWATVASWFFYDGGAEAVGSTTEAQAPEVVTLVANQWLGAIGGVLALLGVVAAPITSGDTALRSARLIIAEFIGMKQKKIGSRLLICLPLFAVTALLIWYNIADKDGFNIIWGYFGWANQTLSVFTLWAITVYLAQQHKPYIITLVPALFMLVVCLTFILISQNGFALAPLCAYAMGGVAFIVAIAWFMSWKRKMNRK
ncbi:MAG: carbon starvation protein A [Bacteroidaceae bacterium]|nr:carbon starvation protein A [Bacteroidaceae bacterium]